MLTVAPSPLVVRIAAVVAIAVCVAASPSLASSPPADLDSPSAFSAGAADSPLRSAAAREALRFAGEPEQAPRGGGDATTRSHEWRPTGLGLGVHTGGFHFGVGASAIGWVSDRVGFEGLVSRYSIGAAASAAGVSASSDFTVMEFSGGVRYRLGSPEGTVHPYLAAGVSLYRSSSSVNVSGYGTSEGTSDSSSNVGGYGVGGLEFTFKSARHLAVSLDLGYYTTSTPFTGLEVGGFALGGAVHWYLK